MAKAAKQFDKDKTLTGGRIAKDKKRMEGAMASLGSSWGGMWGRILGDVNEGMRKGASEYKKMMGEAAKATEDDFKKTQFAATQVGQAGYQNLDFSSKLTAIAQERFEIETRMADLDGSEREAKLRVLEKQEIRYKTLQKEAEINNRKNAILTRGTALIDGMQKQWEDISAVIMSTVTTWQGAVVTSALLNKHIGGIAQNMGVAHTEAMGFATTGAILGPAFKAMGLDVQASQKALLDNFNSMDEATFKNVANMGLLQIQTGLTADQAGKASRMFSLIEGSNAESGMSMIRQVNAQAKLAGAIPAKVIEDMTANSDKIAEYWAGNVESLTAAAIQASKLGLSISQVSEAAGKMLDIESSIAAEMEAEVLLGRQLNLDKAREAALTGDSETLMKELVKNAGSLEQFNSMNVIQRQKLAAALGLNVADLQKMVQEEKTSSTTWGKITSEASKYATYITGAAPAFMGMVNNSKKFMDNISSVNLSGLWTKLKSLRSGGGGAAAAKAASIGPTQDAAGKWRDSKGRFMKAPKGPPAKSKGGLGFIEKMNPAKMLAGALAMVLVSAALFITAKAMQEFMKVGWEDMAKAGVALLGLVGILAIVGAIMMSGVGALAILAGAAALLLFGIALMAIGKGIQLTRDGLTGFAVIMAELVPMVPGMLGLAYAFGLLGIGLVSLSAGLLLLAPMLPIIMALGAMATIAIAMGGGGGAAEGEAMDIKSASIESKLDALTLAILTQPISISIDGKELATRTEMAHNRAIDVV